MGSDRSIQQRRVRAGGVHLCFAQEPFKVQRQPKSCLPDAAAALWAVRRWTEKTELLCLHSLPPKLETTCRRVVAGSVSKPPL